MRFTRLASTVAAALLCGCASLSGIHPAARHAPLRYGQSSGGSEVGSFPNASALNGSERILADQSATTVNILPSQIATYLGVTPGTVVSFTGFITATHCAEWSASGILEDSGSGCGGSGTPGGSSYSIQYNNASVFGGLLPGSTGTWCFNWSSLSAAPTLVSCGSGSGTVTSVNLAVPTWLTVSGCPITTSGTCTIAGATGLTDYELLGTGSTGTLGLIAPPSGVAGSYTNANITVNQYGIVTAAANGSGGGPLQLSASTNTQQQTIEDTSLAAGAAPLQIASFTGSGTLTNIQVIGDYTTASGGWEALGNLLFLVYIDGATTPVVFDGSLWAAPGLITSSYDPNFPGPLPGASWVFESGHLQANFGLDLDYTTRSFQLAFKFPIPYSSSAVVDVYSATTVGPTLSALYTLVESQTGTTYPQRLHSSYTYGGYANATVEKPATWSSSTDYAAGNLAVYTDGNVYLCILAAEGSGEAPGNTTYWRLIGPPVSPLRSAAPWASTTAYAVDSLVQYDASGTWGLYQCITANTDEVPTNTTYWTAVSTSSDPNLNTGYPLLQTSGPAWIVSYSFGYDGIASGAAGTTFLESNLAVYDGSTPAASFPGISPMPTYNSSGTEDFMGGSFYWETNGAPVYYVRNSYGGVPISAISGNGTDVTITVPYMPQGYQALVGNPITVSGVSDSGYNGDYSIVSVTSTTVTYADTDTTSASGGIVLLPHVYEPPGRTGSTTRGWGLVGTPSGYTAGANVDLLESTGGIHCATYCYLRWEGGNNSSTGPIDPNGDWNIAPTVLSYQ